jgi:hypothetical protein
MVYDLVRHFYFIPLFFFYKKHTLHSRASNVLNIIV